MSTAEEQEEQKEAEAKEHRKRLRHERARWREDLRLVMGSGAGRRTVWWVLETLTGLDNGSWTGDPLRTAFNEGKRDVGISLRAALHQVTPVEYLEMLQERLAALPPPKDEPVDVDE